jgi:DNA-binding NarL/FixJ family response regulator
VIVSSGYSNDPVLSNYQEYGFKGFITKPYHFEDFGAVLSEVIKGK